MRIEPLHNRDQARALIDCAYEIYGLTFHRQWLYEPEQLLELNQRGDIISLLAVEGHRVIGHLAIIRPNFEVTRGGLPITSDRLREVGLSIVRPDFRQRGIQNDLSAAAVEHMVKMGMHGCFMKCVTHHRHSQRSARRCGASPVAMSLGSIPRYVVYEGEVREPEQPISTLMMHLPLRPLSPARGWLPSGMDWAQSLWPGLGDAPRRMPSIGASDLEVCWQGDRQLAQIYVLHAGSDLVSRLREACRWLIGGHMAHISVYLPTDSPVVAQAGDAFTEMGLFPCGWIPGFYRGGRDVVVMQAMVFQNLEVEQVGVIPEAQRLRAQVLGGWRRCRGRALRLLRGGRKGRVRVQVVPGRAAS